MPVMNDVETTVGKNYFFAVGSPLFEGGFKCLEVSKYFLINIKLHTLFSNFAQK
jgi:hypothetical protein